MTVWPVLVIDDGRHDWVPVVAALASINLPTRVVKSVAEAITNTAPQASGTILLAVHRDDASGLETIRELRAQASTAFLPIVALLEDTSREDEARTAGADDTLTEQEALRATTLGSRLRTLRALIEARRDVAQRTRDASLVTELTQALASNLDFRGILFTVVQRMAEVAKVERASVVLVHDDGVGYVVAASDDELLRDLPIDLAKYPEIQQAITSGTPLLIDDVDTHPVLETFRNEGNQIAYSSLAILPIVYEGRAMGVLSLRSRARHTFEARELAMCRTIVATMAIALRNARILQTLRDRTKEVTEARHEAERRMKSLQRYADFFESSSDGIVVIGAGGKLHFSNPRAQEITGHPAEDFRTGNLRDFFVDRALTQKLLAGFAEHEFPKGVDISIRRQSGELAILNVNFSLVIHDPELVLCTFRDVTEDRAVAAELLKTKEFLQRVIDSSVDAVITADLRGRIVLFNRAAERLSGRSAAEVVGSRVTLFYPPGGAMHAMARIREGGGRVQGVPSELLDGQGNLVPVLFSGSLIYDGDRPVGTVGIFTDLREKVQMEARLQEAQGKLLARERQAIIAELAGAAAHELNQPLTTVLNYSLLLKKLVDPGSSFANAANVIAAETERMADIVRKIGTITRYETKSYVGAQNILDLDRASSELPPSAKELP